MLKYISLPIICIILFFISLPVKSDITQYIRDYTYRAHDFDTKYTSRIRAIDGVKQNLLEELGTHIESVIRIHVKKNGEKYIEHDYVNLTAGFISTDILKEDWNYNTYYVQARLRADPDEVKLALIALRKDLKLEHALRESIQNLTKARDTISILQEKMKLQKNKTELTKLNKAYISAAQNIEVEYQYQHAIKYIIDRQFDKAYQLLKNLAD